MTDLGFMPPRVGVPVPQRDMYVFMAYTFFIAAVGFAVGWIIAKYVW
jgi:hypothetical protein